jgi:hypothetical protein
MPGKLTGQVSTGDTELTKVVIVALIGLFGVYLERRMTQKAEENHKYLESQKTAYYNFVTLISKLQETSYEWDHTTVTGLWLAALEAGQYGDLEAVRSRFHIRKDEYLIVEDLKGKKLPMVEENDRFIIEITSLKEYISFLGAVQLYPNNIFKDSILLAGKFFSTAFANKLLNEIPRIGSWWRFWK